MVPFFSENIEKSVEFTLETKRVLCLVYELSQFLSQWRIKSFHTYVSIFENVRFLVCEYSVKLDTNSDTKVLTPKDDLEEEEKKEEYLVRYKMLVFIL